MNSTAPEFELEPELDLTEDILGIGRCKTCKWWQGREKNKFGWISKYCDHPKIGGGDIETDGVEETDDLQMGPDFGCVHWEDKE